MRSGATLDDPNAPRAHRTIMRRKTTESTGGAACRRAITWKKTQPNVSARGLVCEARLRRPILRSRAHGALESHRAGARRSTMEATAAPAAQPRAARPAVAVSDGATPAAGASFVPRSKVLIAGGYSVGTFFYPGQRVNLKGQGNSSLPRSAVTRRMGESPPASLLLPGGPSRRQNNHSAITAPGDRASRHCPRSG